MSVGPVVEVYIRTIAGNCPVQGYGTIDGKPFYFRAQGDSWSVIIGGDAWTYEEEYGRDQDAGWMSKAEAEAFIHQAAARFVRG